MRVYSLGLSDEDYKFRSKFTAKLANLPKNTTTTDLLDIIDATKAKSCIIPRSEEHTSELQSQSNLVCRLLLEKKKNTETTTSSLGRKYPSCDGAPRTGGSSHVLPTTCPAPQSNAWSLTIPAHLPTSLPLPTVS